MGSFFTSFAARSTAFQHAYSKKPNTAATAAAATYEKGTDGRNEIRVTIPTRANTPATTQTVRRVRTRIRFFFAGSFRSGSSRSNGTPTTMQRRNAPNVISIALTLAAHRLQSDTKGRSPGVVCGALYWCSSVVQSGSAKAKNWSGPGVNHAAGARRSHLGLGRVRS